MVTPVALAPGVWRIPLVGDWVNGFILRDDDGQVTLVDMGIRGCGGRVLAGLAAIGSGPGDVTRQLLTHAHPDHAGGAATVAEQTGRDFQIHADDAPYARLGEGPPSQATGRIGRLMERFGGGRYTPLAVEHELSDGEILPVAGGLRVVHTPGHTPGHAAFLHEPSGVLITGDSIFNVLGIRWPLALSCTDFPLTQQTAHRLTELDYSVAAFTHGPEITERPRERIRQFLAGTPGRTAAS